ncbi:MAG TPA: EamA family transporter [Candidatus Limnocylindria bacterium]|nr:EamA family transporter [Candidatus Limnocylindria bacterium]
MASPRSDRQAPEWKIWLALAIIYVVWGSTYLAIWLVVETMPPLLSAGVRFGLAGVVLLGVVALRNGWRALLLRRAEIYGAAFVGVTLLLGGNGLVMLGERDVPSGLAALIIAVVPLWVIVLRLLFRESVHRGTLVGVVFGFSGVAVLVLPRGMSGSVPIEGMLMLVAAGASWSVGSYYSKRLSLPLDPLTSTGAQMVLGGGALLAAGLIAGELGLVVPEAFSDASLISLLYLVVFGSILAYTAYTWLLQATSVSRVATYAYVNPVVAVFLGWWLLDEEVGLSIVTGAAMIVVAVALVIRTEARPARTAGALEAAPAQAALSQEELEAVRAER